MMRPGDQRIRLPSLLDWAEGLRTFGPTSGDLIVIAQMLVGLLSLSSSPASGTKPASEPGCLRVCEEESSAQACSRGWSEAEPPEEGEPQVSSPNGAAANSSSEPSCRRPFRASVLLDTLSRGWQKSRQPRATCLGPFRADHRFGSKESIHQSHRAPERCVTGRG